MASLFIIQGPDQGLRVEITAEPVTIGRDRANSIQLNDQEISRHHAELSSENGGFQIADLGSSNGTFVNGQRVDRHQLSNGDRIHIGRSVLIFTGAGSFIDELANDVDIVGTEAQATESRIIRTVPYEDESCVVPARDSDSAWLARARSDLDVMYHTALATSHTLDTSQLLHRIMELVFEWVEADRGCIMLIDPESGELTPAVRRNRPGIDVDKRMVISRTILDYVLQRKEGVLTSDASEDDRWDAARSILSMGVREAICIPMQGRYGVIGAIYIDTFTRPGDRLQRPAGSFKEDHLKLMVAIGHQAALAIEDTRYYSAMVQAEKLAAVGQTIASLSHHIKNILQGIQGGSFLIEEGITEHQWEAVEQGWSLVERNQERISNLVLDMLSFSKDRKPEMVAADLNEVVEDVISLLQSRAEKQSTDLIWQPQVGLPEICFDPDGIHRAVLNVVINALDACSDSTKREVVVSTNFEPQSQLAKIVVVDSGDGIAEEDLPKIFSLFESRKGQRGTGIGLPVSQKIMQEHNGEIQAASDDQGGAKFSLVLPAVVAPPKFSETMEIDLEDSKDSVL